MAPFNAPYEKVLVRSGVSDARGGKPSLSRLGVFATFFYSFFLKTAGFYRASSYSKEKYNISK